MLFQLKDVFINEGTSAEVSFKMDMSEVDLYGIYPFTSPVNVHAVAQNRAGLVSLNIKTDFLFVHPCDRCLDEIRREYSYSFNHVLVVSLSGNSDENDGDYIEVPEYEIDLDELAQADILLELPSKFLCSDACKGICMSCGKNLNEGLCGCFTRKIDPRLEILKELIDD